MNKKRDYFFAVCILFCIGLLLWFDRNKRFTQSEGDSKSPSPELTENTETYAMEIPASWKEEIDSYNRIDATIVVPDCIRNKGFLRVNTKNKEVNYEDVLPLLEDYYHPRKTMEDERCIQYLGEDNMRLNFIKQNYEVLSLYSHFYDYVSMAYRDKLAEGYNRDCYPVDRDLESFTLNECDDRIMNLCKSIGIEGEIDIVHHTLDYRTMEAEAEELHEDGSRTKPDYYWSDADSCYYCTFSQICNGIPIIPNYNLQSSGDIINASEHICLLNKERFVSFRIGKIYDIQYENEYEELMAFQDIVERYRKYAGMAKQDYETVITDITMRVFMVNQGDGTYRAVPIWIFYGDVKFEGETWRGRQVVFIDAMTGEML